MSGEKKRWRRALFQVHLWAGLVLAGYVLLMSVSGTILIYRVEISKASVRGAPHAGRDAGDAVPASFRFIEWLTDLHDNLLYEPVGRVVNGIGGAATVLLCVSGAMVWWPGSGRWRRALAVNWKAGGVGLNRRLHRVVGIWSVAFIVLWGFSGVYLAVPEPFETAVAFLDPPVRGSRKASVAEQSLSWLARLHFGRFGGMPTKLVWTVFGLAPIGLVITGVWMWWTRVVRPRMAAAP